ncbi:MAG: serine protease [Methylococcaceae bacterium]|nr:serine protease [Methylococcaceae bacterium]
MLYTEQARALSQNPKIIGGAVANSNDWPWVTGLVYRSDITVFCGGSLIAKNWVLTAAHCVNDKVNALDVLINRAQLTSTQGERIAVKQIIIHPLFNRKTLQNDIALLKLAGASNSEPIEVINEFSHQDEAGQNAIALGWGNTSTFKKTFPDELQQVILPIISNAECKKRQTTVVDSMLCAGFDEGGKDTCEGDSGGPLIVFDSESQSWQQAGITSFGVSNCAAAGFYGVYTRLQLFKPFIMATICDAEQRPSAPALKLAVNSHVVTATWNTLVTATGYSLSYAPYPVGNPIYSLKPLQHDRFSVNLPTGSAYYVGITANDGSCRSELSNIEHFAIE